MRGAAIQSELGEEEAGGGENQESLRESAGGLFVIHQAPKQRSESDDDDHVEEGVQESVADDAAEAEAREDADVHGIGAFLEIEPPKRDRKSIVKGSPSGLPTAKRHKHAVSSTTVVSGVEEGTAAKAHETCGSCSCSESQAVAGDDEAVLERVVRKSGALQPLRHTSLLGGPSIHPRQAAASNEQENAAASLVKTSTALCDGDGGAGFELQDCLCNAASFEDYEEKLQTSPLTAWYALFAIQSGRGPELMSLINSLP